MIIYRLKDKYIISNKNVFTNDIKEVVVRDFELKPILETFYDIKESEVDFALSELYKNHDDYMRFGINNSFIYTGKLMQ